MRGRSFRAAVALGGFVCLGVAFAPALGAAATTLTVTPASKKLPSKSAAGTLTVNVQSTDPQVEVTVSESSDWFAFTQTAQTVTLANGKGTASFSWAVDGNESSLNRSASVTVSAPGAEAKTFSVSQTGVPCQPRLSFLKTAFDFVGGEGSFAVDAPLGCPWTLSVGAAQWIAPNATTGEGDATVTYEVGLNGGNPRTGKITLSARDPNTGKSTGNKVHTVTQAKRAKPKALVVGTPLAVQDTGEATVAFCGGHALFSDAFGPDGLSSLLGDFGGFPGAAFRMRADRPASPVLQRLLGAALARLGPVAQRARTATRTISQPVHEIDACDDGGTMTVSGKVTVNDQTYAIAATLTVEAEDCRTGDEVANGMLSGSFKVNEQGVTSGGGKLGSPSAPFVITTVDSQGASVAEVRTALTVSLSDAALDLADPFNPDLSSFRVTADGYADETDLVADQRSLVDLASLSIAFSTGDAGVNSATLNGAIRVAELAGAEFVASREVTFSNLQATVTGELAGGDITAAIDGTVAIRTVPADGAQGTFQFATPVPLHLVNGEIESGTLTLNGATILITGESATLSVGGTQAQINIGESCTL